MSNQILLRVYAGNLRKYNFCRKSYSVTFSHIQDETLSSQWLRRGSTTFFNCLKWPFFFLRTERLTRPGVSCSQTRTDLCINGRQNKDKSLVRCPAPWLTQRAFQTISSLTKIARKQNRAPSTRNYRRNRRSGRIGLLHSFTKSGRSSLGTLFKL